MELRMHELLIRGEGVRLDLVQFTVLPIAGQQFCVHSLLDNLPVLHASVVCQRHYGPLESAILSDSSNAKRT